MSADVRRHLVATLFASPASLAIGAVAGGAAGISAASLSNDSATIFVGLAVPVAGAARVVQASLMNRADPAQPSVVRAEVHYEIGAWLFSALLGLLAFLVLTRSSDGGLQLLASCVALGYAAGICARNAGRPTVALGQLTLSALPLTVGLALSDDPTRWVLAIVNVLFILGMSDITRRTYLAFQSAVAESRARENDVREQLDHLPNMIWSADATGRITFRSSRWKEFTGLDLDQWEAGALLVHAADQAAVQAAWRRSVESGAPFEAAFRLRHRSGEFRRVLNRARPERDAAGGVLRWHGACVDIHEHALVAAA
jgi:PAS domain S-box-containing protein